MVYSGVSADRKIRDTCFVYDKKKNERTFGRFENGILRSGIFAIDDKFGILGNWDDNGKKYGYCVSYDSEDDLFITGNYKNGKLHGQIVSFNDKKDIIYIGEANEGEMTGEGILLKNKLIYAGQLKKGLLEGNGKIIYPNGRIISGEYSGGKLIAPGEVILPGGKKLDIKPKDVNTAINFLLKEWENDFINIKSEELLGYMSDEYKCLYYFPGGKSRILTNGKDTDGKPHSEFSAEIRRDTDYSLIKREYDALCKKLSACFITTLAKGKSLKLIPKINKLDADGKFERIASFFYIPAYAAKKADPMVRVMVENRYDGYRLTVDIMQKWKQ
jgi:antitoxin component YwqK of YwqJK toxin-antitoxin module